MFIKWLRVFDRGWGKSRHVGMAILIFYDSGSTRNWQKIIYSQMKKVLPTISGVKQFNLIPKTWGKK